MCATGATHDDDTSGQSRFSRKSRESGANNEIGFTRNDVLRNFATNRHE